MVIGIWLYCFLFSDVGYVFFFPVVSKRVYNVKVGMCVAIPGLLENTLVKNTGRTPAINTEFNKREYRCMTFHSKIPPIPAVMV